MGLDEQVKESIAVRSAVATGEGYNMEARRVTGRVTAGASKEGRRGATEGPAAPEAADAAGGPLRSGAWRTAPEGARP